MLQLIADSTGLLTAHLSLVGAGASKSHEGVLVSIALLQRLRQLTDLWLPCDPCQLSSFLLILSQLSLPRQTGR